MAIFTDKTKVVQLFNAALSFNISHHILFEEGPGGGRRDDPILEITLTDG